MRPSSSAHSAPPPTRELAEPPALQCRAHWYLAVCGTRYLACVLEGPSGRWPVGSMKSLHACLRRLADSQYPARGAVTSSLYSTSHSGTPRARGAPRGRNATHPPGPTEGPKISPQIRNSPLPKPSPPPTSENPRPPRTHRPVDGPALFLSCRCCICH